MPRVPRYLQWSEEACFHLMNRGHNREPVFAHDEDRRAFIDLVARYRDRFGFRLLHCGVSPVGIGSERPPGAVAQFPAGRGSA